MFTNNALLGGGVRVRVWIREQRKIKGTTKQCCSCMLLLSLGVCTTHVHTVHTNGNKLTGTALYYGDIYMAFTMYTMYVACGHVGHMYQTIG